jgi:hypothetical protein
MFLTTETKFLEQCAHEVGHAPIQNPDTKSEERDKVDLDVQARLFRLESSSI